VSTPVLRPIILVLLHLFLLSFTTVYVLCCRMMLAADTSFIKRIWWWWWYLLTNNYIYLACIYARCCFHRVPNVARPLDLSF